MSDAKPGIRLSDITVERILTGGECCPGPKEGALRVWWIPQVPMGPFYVPVSSLDEAAKLLQILAAYDIFQLVHNIKPDFSNAGGVDIFEDGEWSEYNEPQRSFKSLNYNSKIGQN